VSRKQHVPAFGKLRVRERELLVRLRRDYPAFRRLTAQRWALRELGYVRPYRRRNGRRLSAPQQTSPAIQVLFLCSMVDVLGRTCLVIAAAPAGSAPADPERKAALEDDCLRPPN
jgi:hypothetical protein